MFDLSWQLLNACTILIYICFGYLTTGQDWELDYIFRNLIFTILTPCICYLQVTGSINGDDNMNNEYL